MEMIAYRKPWFWFSVVILPNFLITMSMLASYAVDYEELEGRCSITVTHAPRKRTLPHSTPPS